ncbi:MAG: hypothetical protein ACKOTZ_01500 [Chloroflexota bacterium]
MSELPSHRSMAPRSGRLRRAASSGRGAWVAAIALVLGLGVPAVPAAAQEERAYTVDELAARCASAPAEIVDACLTILYLVLVPEAGRVPPGLDDGPTAPTAGTGATIGDGTWRVGVDIAPGTYRTRSAESCYWARLSGFGGSMDEVIANGFDDGYAVVTIAAGDVGFESSGCSWSSDLSAVVAPGAAIPDGVLIVGTDIAPGTYRTSGADCYWARLSGFSGDLDDIIANDLPGGPSIVTIGAGDRGFASRDCAVA